METKIYTIFWLTGDTQLVEGYDPAHAMNSAGIGNGALRAIDFWAEGDIRSQYVWNPGRHIWNNIKQEVAQ